MRRILLFIVIIALITVTSSAYEEGWHDSEKCDPCHATILSEIQSEEIIDGCVCHYISNSEKWETNVDINSVKTLHNIEPCIKCHLNSKATLTEENIHRVHTSVNCSLCHGDLDIKRPGALQCHSCHGNEIHGIHKDKIDDTCVACHGAYGEDATLIESELSERSFTKKYKEFPTIIDILRFILKM